MTGPVTGPVTAPLEITFDVEAAQQHAFETWTVRFGDWWPRSHTVSGREDAVVELQPYVGGAIGERMPDGSHHAWGLVTAWDPPAEFGYDWHFGREVAEATRVRVRFVALAEHRTRVEIRHDGWDALGGEAATWRQRNAGGWQRMLPHYLGQLEKETMMSKGTKDDPWQLTTAPGSSTYAMWRDEGGDPPALVCQVGSTTLKYRLEAVEDLHHWLLDQGDWVDLGATDEQKDAGPGTVEAFGRAEDNPAGGWYGLRRGYRGRFGMYLPPLLEHLGLAELTHDKRNNRVRAVRA